MLRKHYLFLIILAFAILLRVYRIGTLTTFGRDQGIDFLSVRDIIVNHHLTLIGIKVSIANFFQGPIYLYMLLPFFWISRLNPLAGAYTAVFVSSLAMIILYITLLKFSNKKLANFTALYFATCPPLVIFGNTPLYQNFLPLFILLTIFFLLSLNGFVFSFLLGLTVGISTELHFLSITLVITTFLYLVFYSRKKIQYIFFVFAGLLLGLSPTILFELRHNFLNVHLLTNYLAETQQAPLAETILTWQTRLPYLMTSGNNIIVLIPAIFGIFLICKNKIPNQNYNILRRFTLILLVVTLLFSLKLSAIEAHYFLPFWITLLVLLPIYFSNIKHQKLFLFLAGLLITINTFITFSQLNNNHGYFMPPGWSLKKIEQVANIIGLDTDKHQNFNVASLLDGDTRAYPLRFVLETQGKSPGAVTAYTANDYLYIVARNEQEITGSTVWEINSFKPFQIGAKWEMEDNITLYRLDRKKNTAY